MKRNNQAFQMAFGGVMAALAVVIMAMGGLILVATFVCPMVCMLILTLVLKQCGRRTAWAWYGAVAILSLLLGPDKEAAAVFLFLGYYPIIKPKFDSVKFGWVLKLLLFNAAIAVMYVILLRLVGLEQVVKDYEELGKALTALMVLMGNVTFLLLDRLLSLRFQVK